MLLLFYQGISYQISSDPHCGAELISLHHWAHLLLHVSIGHVLAFALNLGHV